jgi:hypothetical protein
MPISDLASVFLVTPIEFLEIHNYIYYKRFSATHGLKKGKIVYNETRIFWRTYADKAHDKNNKGFRYNYCYTELVPPTPHTS